MLSPTRLNTLNNHHSTKLTISWMLPDWTVSGLPSNQTYVLRSWDSTSSRRTWEEMDALHNSSLLHFFDSFVQLNNSQTLHALLCWTHIVLGSCSVCLVVYIQQDSVIQFLLGMSLNGNHHPGTFTSCTLFCSNLNIFHLYREGGALRPPYLIIENHINSQRTTGDSG